MPSFRRIWTQTFETSSADCWWTEEHRDAAI
jgi:hypothetical protein